MGKREWGKKERRTKKEEGVGSGEWGGYIEFIPGWGLWLMGVRVGGG
jgi:hypothetical protein